jgi:hypothetical protein
LFEFLVADILIGEILTRGLLGSPKPAHAATYDMSASSKISVNLTAITASISSKSEYKYTVYELVDRDGNVKYVGRTRQKLRTREKQHWYTDSNKKGLEINAVIHENKTLKGLTYDEAR